jgi:secreted peptidase, family M23
MATQKESRKEQLKRKWLSKYRLVVMDDETFEEKASFRLSRLNIFVFGSLFALVVITFTVLLLIYTPLRQYVLGYTAVENKQETLQLLLKSNSLEKKVKNSEAYITSLKKVLVGDIKPQRHDKDTTSVRNYNPKFDPKAVIIKRSKQDSILRKQVEEEDVKARERNNEANEPRAGNSEDDSRNTQQQEETETP